MFMPGRKRKKAFRPSAFADIGTKGITLPWYHPDFRMLGHSLNAGNGALHRLRLLKAGSAQMLAGELHILSHGVAYSLRPRSLDREMGMLLFLFIALEYS